MKKIISIIVFSILLFTFQFSVSQTTAIYRYQIRFTDKNNNPFSISLPQEYLSQKAIDRREKQHLLIDSLDLPVTPAYIDSVKNTGVIVLYSSKWLNSVTIFTTDSLALVHINSFSFVKSIKAVGKILPHQNNSLNILILH